MSCYDPIEIVSPKKVFDLDSPDLIKLLVPCGHCQGCLDRQAREYSLRTFYEFIECVHSGGYAIFDCLTYSPRSVPRLKYYLDGIDLMGHGDDFCFDFDDLRYFFVRLRRRLSYLGYPKDVFRYFYSSEYGTRRTKRPHYHLMLFVKSVVPPLVMSRLISDCWQLGRTDGVKYRGSSYVMNHCVFDGCKSLEHVYNTTEYVTKYILKDLELRSKYHNLVMSLLYPLFKTRNYNELKISQRKLYRYVFGLKSNFHRHSQGFGSYLLKVIPESYIRSHCNVYFPNKFSDSKMPVPLYFIRKLYTYRVKCKDYETYVYSDAGKEFLLNRLRMSVRNTYDEFRGLNAMNVVDYDPKVLTYYKIYDYGRNNVDKVSQLGDLLPKGLIHDLCSENKVYNYLDRKSNEDFGYCFVSPYRIDSSGAIDFSTVISKEAFIDACLHSNLPSSVSSACDSQVLRLHQWYVAKGKKKRLAYLKNREIKRKFKEYVTDY